VNRSWITLILLIIASTLGFMDRQVLSFLVAPIKSDFGVSDLQISLLQGFAFAAFYTLAAVPIGGLIDTRNRVKVLSVGIAAWSLMTAAGGFARNYLQLFAARLGVGVGEATLGPAAHSMIADLFPKHRMPLAMSVYGLGVALGAGIGYAVGGVIVRQFLVMGSVDLPVLGVVRAWQAVFFVVGAPGLLVALMIRGLARDPVRHRGVNANWADLREFIRLRWRVLLPLVLGISCFTANSFAILNWAPEFLRRQWTLGPDEAGKLLGVMMVLGPLPGGLACGAWAARLAKRGDAAASLKVMGITGLVAAPLVSFACVSMHAGLALAAMVVPMLISQCYVGLGPASVQHLAPVNLRGRLAALYLLLTSLLGMSIGPLAVAAISDLVLKDESRLGIALGVSSGFFHMAGAGFLLFSIRGYRRVCLLDK